MTDLAAESSAEGWTRRGRFPELAIAAFVMLILLLSHSRAIWRELPRPLDHDEAEYLHSAWLIAEGETIYRDFMEDHPPFLFLVLGQMIPTETTPAFPLVDIQTWAVRARVFAALCGSIAALAVCALVFRVTGSPAGAVLTLALLLDGGTLWLRGVADIRADAPSLALFLTGTLMLLWRASSPVIDAWLHGAGLGLVIGALLINPKWPLEALILLVIYGVRLVGTIRERRIPNIVGMLLPPIVVLVAAALSLSGATTFRDFLFFNFQLKSQNLERLRSNPWIAMSFGQSTPYSFLPGLFKGWSLIAAILVTVTGLFSQRGVPRLRPDQWRVMAILILAVAAAVEVRFVYPFPYLWPQYLLMLVFLLSAAYGIGAASLERLVSRPVAGSSLLARCTAIGALLTLSFFLNGTVSAMGGRKTLLPTLAFVLATLAALSLIVTPLLILRSRSERLSYRQMATVAIFCGALVACLSGLQRKLGPSPPDRSGRWEAMSYQQQRLGAGDSVWVTASLHPIGVRDGSYYWYSFQDLVPMTLEFAKRNRERAKNFLPQLSEQQLPICTATTGTGDHVRFIFVSNYLISMPEVCPCARRLVASGDFKPTPFPGLFERVDGAESGSEPVPDWFAGFDASLAVYCKDAPGSAARVRGDR